MIECFERLSYMRNTEISVSCKPSNTTLTSYFKVQKMIMKYRLAKAKYLIFNCRETMSKRSYEMRKTQ